MVGDDLRANGAGAVLQLDVDDNLPAVANVSPGRPVAVLIRLVLKQLIDGVECINNGSQAP